MKKFRPVCLILVLCLVLVLPLYAMAASSEHSSHESYDEDCEQCLAELRIIHDEHEQSVDSSCIPCRVKAMILALPEANDITLGNAVQVVSQIHAIDRIKFEMSNADYEVLIANDVDKYHKALGKIELLQQGTSLVVAKEFLVAGDNTPDLSAAQVHFQLEKQDGVDWTPCETLTLSTLDVSAVGYQADANGWTYTYPLLPGTYRLTELDEPIIINGVLMDTSSVTWKTESSSGDGNVAIFTIDSQEQPSLTFTNTTTPVVIKLSVDPSELYDSDTETIRAYEGISFTVTATISNNPGDVTYSWQLQPASRNITNVADSHTGDFCEITPTLEMSGKDLLCTATLKTGDGTNRTSQKTLHLVVEPNPDAPSPDDDDSGSVISPEDTHYSGSSVPKTGDSTPLALLACMAALSLIGLCLLERRRSA